jgi:hypothetical protein
MDSALRMKGVTAFFIVCFLLMTSTIYAQDFPDTFLNGRIHTVRSEILNQDRVTFIYLPADYENGNLSYPVHYITDAPATSNVFHDLLRLHTIGNEMPDGIVVGLSSDDREYHLQPEEGGEKYLQFLTKELIPFVENNYRTNSFRSSSSRDTARAGRFWDPHSGWLGSATGSSLEFFLRFNIPGRGSTGIHRFSTRRSLRIGTFCSRKFYLHSCIGSYP